MKSFANSCLINAALSALLGIFTLLSSRKKEARYWSLYSITVAMWSSGLGLMVSATSFSEAFFWLRWLHYLGAIMIPIFFFHFVTSYIKKPKPRLIAMGYVLAVCQQFLSIGGHLATVEPLSPFNFYTIPKPAYAIFVAYFFSYVFYAHILLFKEMRSASGLAKKHLKYIFFGTAIAFCGGSTAFFPVFHWPVFPYGVYGVFAYILTVTYAILNDQLMDIRLVLRDTTLHALTAALLGGSAILLSFPLVPSYPTAGIILSTTVMGLLMAFAYDPIRKALQPAIDRIMFANRFGYLEELSQLPNDLLEFTNLREMLKFLVTRLTEAAKLERVRIFMYDPGHQSYIETQVHAKTEQQSENKSSIEELPETSALVRLLRSDGKLWTREEIKRKGDASLISDLVALQGAACFPVNKENDLLGVVVLGPKRSGEPFNQQDMRILDALRVRLENFLAQAMTITQEALNMVKDSHDMKNDVNALKGRVTWRAMRIAGWKIDFEKHVLAIDSWITAEEAKGARGLEHEQAKQTLSSLKSQALEWFREAESSRTIEDQAIQRLAHRLKNWAEYGRVVSEGFRGTRAMEAIEVGDAVRICVERWKPHAEKKNLQLFAETVPDLVVWGERSLLEQVIENLIDNAIKATKQGQVNVICRADRDGILLEVKDTGCGIPAEDLPTIFEKPFYQGKGRETLEQSTGVGLYLVSQYVRSLGGQVRAESQVGKGSSFFVHLPRYDQERKGAAA